MGHASSDLLSGTFGTSGSDADNDNPPSRDRHGKIMATEIGSKGLSLSRELWTIRVILFSSSNHR